ncbi:MULTISPECIES: 4'-phosphopantetheinyl transferase [Micromonospora]|uniref:4'-phosphopantetheinyl transferase superfamily protein n=1 Tax=Micromonospora solifontis TaxID=2487138 RepID=A0ABX9WL42_9ACTN|nr:MULTISPECIES: 4'-phosphopantetheinyl transferase superfamily protein [Micromonospora]NES14883.1 4'-phosphopantetheinyl transferase superfamily protein [Micromonospora sp. PPF5-17B]NES35194.1 4'-phosphopantetheinyl transferase superfamily protein [Micromonospora solifontis]NES55189.1 4'-phosphopantetheinyl transferase superfamily protein [Micromonospora sp. PPF5-6]RNM01173.1 4'-phosphopantetheinyl transferase superfamily protein [Micromonospora solifontis]
MIETLLPPAVVSVHAFADIPGEAPYPGEQDLVARAVETRRREFVTARRCAREALGKLGHVPGPIRSGPRREPVWPAGVVGSITHCAGYRAAAVARGTDLAGLGIDAEPHEALPEGVGETVTVGGEPDLLRRLDREDPTRHWGRLLFSAKESVYKAWYPLTGRWLGFEDAELSIDPAGGGFTARVLVDGGRIDGGPPLAVLHGRWLIARGLIVTAVTVPR